MKVQDLVEKLAVRIKPVDRPGTVALFGGGTQRDTSYCHKPIKIESVENGIVFFRSEPSGELSILSPDFCDDSWAPLPTRLYSEFWKEKSPAEKT